MPTRAILFLLIVLTLAACGAPAQPLQTTDTPTAEELPTEPVAPSPIALPTPTATLPSPAEHRIAIRQVDGVAEFFDRGSGQTFVPRGVNYVFVPHEGQLDLNLLKVGVYDPERTRLDFQALADRGYNTVRVFLDHCNQGSGCIGDEDNQGLNPAYLDNIADMMAAAKEAGLFILFTSNDLPDQGGYAEQANGEAGETFAGYRNAYFLTQSGLEAARQYWSDLLTGLRERSAAFDAVLAWQLLNEEWLFADQPPLSLTSGSAETPTGVYDLSDPQAKRRMVDDTIVNYIAVLKSEILRHDPTALVTMGFFAPEIAAPGWYVQTAPLLERSELDFFDFHLYPGGHTQDELVAAFGMQGYEVKPILLGEYGAFRHIYPDILPAAREINAWQAESCTHGFDGWLYWTYYPAPAYVDDRTWGLVDEDGFLLETLSPSLHPDPCETLAIYSDDLAYGKPAHASENLPENPAELAVDENAASHWGSGADAPQWIEIDLQAEYTLERVELLVSQYPAGETRHLLRGRSASGNWQDLHTFEGRTTDGDHLVFTPETPVPAIQFLRIDTLASPSWVSWYEVEVYGLLPP